MTALWITNEAPNRNLGGGNIRQAHLLNALARRLPTDLLVRGGPDAETRDVVRRMIEVPEPKLRPPPSARLGRRVRALRFALSRRPSDLLVSGPEIQALAAAAPHETYDLACVVHLGLAPLRQVVPAKRWILLLHHLPSEQARHSLELAPARRQRWLWRRELENALHAERDLSSQFDLIVLASSDDARVFGRPHIVAPNGVDLGAFEAMPVPDNRRLVFTGTLSYRPNVDGIQWFCREILPLIRARVDDVTLDIVGRAPVPEVKALADIPGVFIHADVPSILPFLQQARVSIVPLRIGSGTRLKALEAMATGRPVVGTTLGLAGLEIIAGTHAAVADTPNAFADAAVRLLLDDNAARAMATHGRALVEQHYDWSAIGARFADVVVER